MDECDEQLASVHHVHLVLLQFLVEEWFLHLQNHLGTIVDFLRVVHQFSTSLHISLVVIKRTFTCRALYQYLEAIGYEFAHRLGCGSYTRFVVHNLLRDSNNHNVCVFKVNVCLSWLSKPL